MRRTLTVVAKIILATVIVVYGLPACIALIAGLVGMIGMTAICPTVMGPVIVVVGCSCWIIFKLIKWVFKKLDEPKPIKKEESK